MASFSAETQNFLASILQCVAQPVWVIDHDGRVTFANPAALAALGYERLEELLGQPSHETIHYKHPDGTPYPASECPLLRPRVTGETVRSEEDWFFRKDGTMITVSYTSAPIETPSGLGAVLAFSDVSERRRAEEALRERELMEARNAELSASELRYRAMLEAAFDAIVSTDRAGRVSYLNAAAQRLFGHAPEAALGSELVMLVVPERLRDEHRRWWREREWEDREVLGRELATTALHASGAEFPVELSVTRVSFGDATGYTAYYRDLTERMRAERELRLARRRVIEAADQERRRIARDLHDGAQQQLVNVAFNLELALQELAEPTSARESVERARDEARAGTSALRELVAGIHPAILVSRGLGAAVSSLASRLPVTVELSLHDGRLTEHVEAAGYFVICEALTNVVKHAQASRASVRTLVADGQLLITVADDGIGGADHRNGSGLTGLADRLAALEGALQMMSYPRRGTTVSARIPLVQRRLDATPPADLGELKDQPAPTSIGTPTRLPHSLQEPS